jgi:hypothetical protein
MIDIDLIPKQQEKPLFGKWFFFIASALLVGGVGIGFFVLGEFEKNNKQTLGVLESTLRNDIQPQEQSLIGELNAARESVERFKAVVAERKDFLPFFQLLERSTHEEVVFSKFTAGRESATTTIEVSGIARDFFTLEQQRLLWKQQSQIQHIEIQNMGLQAEGRVSFDATLELVEL